jgi:prepilin-type N-terminal cleavage/methylation domain-containing protein/prepilin-type processing-associated H-X9-DG protein
MPVVHQDFTVRRDVAMSLKRDAFTLIELLVVIAIVAILAALLFPVFSAARAKARQTAGLHNERQVATAVRMYATDYDEWFPRHAYGFTGGGRPGSYQWQHAINPYIRNWQIFVCPQAPNLNGIARYNGIDYASHQILLGLDPRGSGPFSGYACNFAYHFHNPLAGWHPMGKHEAIVEDSVGTVVVHEWTGNFRFGWAKPPGAPGSGPEQPADPSWLLTPDPVTGAIAARHMNGINIAFCDGHAKWLEANQAYDRRTRPQDGYYVAYRYTYHND